jgi:hypothetical protein
MSKLPFNPVAEHQLDKLRKIAADLESQPRVDASRKRLRLHNRPALEVTLKSVWGNITRFSAKRGISATIAELMPFVDHPDAEIKIRQVFENNECE